MNKVILTGRITKDPEMKTFQSGAVNTTFTLAVQRRFRNKNTNEREADFINCVAWGKAAELICKYMTKGRKMGVVGEIQTRSYDAQDGSKRYVTEVNVDEIEFLDSGAQGYSETASAANGGFDEVDDDQLPF